MLTLVEWKKVPAGSNFYFPGTQDKFQKLSDRTYQGEFISYTLYDTKIEVFVHTGRLEARRKKNMVIEGKKNG